MNYRIALGGGVAVITLILITGLALGDDSKVGDDSSELLDSAGSFTELKASLSSVAAPEDITILEGSSRTFQIGHAGTVLVGRFDDRLKIIAVQPTMGWISDVRNTSGREVGGLLSNPYIAVSYSFVLTDGVIYFDIESVDRGLAPAESNILATAELDDLSTPEDTIAGPPSTAVVVTTTSSSASPSTTTTESGPSSTSPSPTTSIPTTNGTDPTTTTAAPITTTAPTTTATTTTVATTTTTATTEAWTQIVVTSAGGSIVVSYRPGEVRLDAASPAPTFLLEDVDEDPKRVQVEFEGDDVTYTLEAKWERGELVTDVDASGPGAD